MLQLAETGLPGPPVGITLVRYYRLNCLPYAVWHKKKTPLPGVRMILLRTALQQATTSCAVVFLWNVLNQAMTTKPFCQLGGSPACHVSLWFPPPLHDRSPTGRDFANVANCSWRGVCLPERCLEICLDLTRAVDRQCQNRKKKTRPTQRRTLTGLHTCVENSSAYQAIHTDTL